MIRRIVPLAFDNIVKTVKETNLNTLVLDRHFLRDLNYKTRINHV